MAEGRHGERPQDVDGFRPVLLFVLLFVHARLAKMSAVLMPSRAAATRLYAVLRAARTADVRNASVADCHAACRVAAVCCAISARMSSTFQLVVLGPSLTGRGNRPDFTPAHQVDRLTGKTLRT